ncbi:MAG: hypothetical protein M3O36_10245 [Myxococcota bacterium]|nr:hypothetical protein [Myxococcota bacterium]
MDDLLATSHALLCGATGRRALTSIMAPGMSIGEGPIIMNCVAATSLAMLATTFVTSNAGAATGRYSYEAVNTYSTCGINPDLNNPVAEARSFRDTMNTIPGSSMRNGFEESTVYDSDIVESDWDVNGHDNIYTDTDRGGIGPTNLLFFSGHGSCNYPIDTTRFCNADSDCTGGKKCFLDNNAHRCIGFADRNWITCSSSDKFNHFVDISTKVCMGENSSTPFTWKHCQTNGSTSYVAMDTSCASEAHFEVPANGNMFGGAVVFMGFEGMPNSWPSTTFGDVGDSATRASHWATRMKNGQSVARAWLDASRLDEAGGGLSGPACVLSMSCESADNVAVWDLENATWLSYPNLTALGYTTCHMYTWCNF